MFTEERLDTGYIIYGTSGGPTFSTDVVVLGSGHENRNQNWDQAKGKWDYGDRKLPSTELDVIQKFFRARKGRAIGFRFKDWADYIVGPSEGLLGLTGKGTSSAAYQLYKQYVSGPDKDFRAVRKPVAGTVQVFVNGVARPTSGAGSWSLDTTTGIVTFVVDAVGGYPSPADDVTWIGEFDTPVRFDTDELKAAFIGATTTTPGVVDQKFFQLASLPIVEIRQD